MSARTVSRLVAGATALCFAMAPTAAALAATPSMLYVDRSSPYCSDTGTGTATRPFCTIGKGARTAVAGQTVEVAAGTYPEVVTVANSGTAGAPIVLTAAQGATVTVSGGANGFTLTGKSYVTVRGFTVTRTSGAGILVKTSSHVVIADNEVSLAGQPVSGLIAKGISLSGTTDSVVSGNRTHHNTDAGIGVTAGSTRNVITRNESNANARQYTRAAAGIDLRNSPSNTVEANRLHDNEDSGLNIWDSSDGSLAVNNLAWDNGDHGIDVHSTADNRVVANTVFRNYDSGIEMTGALRTNLANNVSVDNGIDSARTSGQIRVDVNSMTTVADFDLLFLSVPTSSRTAFLDWGGVKYTSLAAFTAATGQESHGIQAAPRFAGTASPPDLHLTAGSPAIDTGNNAAGGEPATDADGVARPINGTVDRGAYESPAAGATNTAPTVNAGSDSAVTRPAAATLDGTVTDDGLPTPPGAVTTTWSKVAGPGTVTFADPAAGDTTATFATAGTYVLRLTADDGALQASDDVTVTVTDPAPTNTAPTVNAGSDSAVTRPTAATLDGTVTDDGLPTPPGAVTTTWSKVAGPGTVTFADPAAGDTTATFATAGTYLLRLTAADGALQASDDVTVTVTDPAPSSPVVLDIPVRIGADDAEERTSTGAVNLTSGDLNLGQDGTAPQTVAMRFSGVTVPAGATITGAWLQFQVDEVSTAACSLTVAGEAADDAAAFTTMARGISSRARTAATVAWTPAAWPTLAARTADQRTPDLAPVLQEIVRRPGWAGGNAVVLMVTGTGTRVAESFEGGAARAPVLHIEYTV
ncbi:right-handed parallel beta-helix repeat-containing protein [Geodermatophilus sp. SYSU D00691]